MLGERREPALDEGREPGLMARFDETLRRRHEARLLIGVDEAGRGPLAGPVVAAAVVLDPASVETLEPVRDSKVLAPARRAALFAVIRRRALRVGVGWSSPEEIDRFNILQATFEAMRRAVARLGLDGVRRLPKPSPAAEDSPPARGGGAVLVAVDGNLRIPDLPFPQVPVVRGDARSLSMACAGVVAKVVRDRWMQDLDRRYPGYGLARHKGYGTAAHREALARLGPSPIHRRSFSPVGRTEAGGTLGGERA